MRGPNENYEYRIGVQHVRTRFYTCAIWVFGEYRLCEERQTITPKRWNGTLHSYAAAGKHDLATKQTVTPGSDCVIPLENKIKSTVAKSHKMKFDLNVGGQILALKASARYTNSTTNSKHFVHEWSVTGRTRPFHHLYVPKGVADGDEEKSKCPATHPSLVWTDSAYYDKTLSASAAAKAHNFVGVMKVIGNRADSSEVTVTGHQYDGGGGGQSQSVSSGIAKADNESVGWFKLWTGPRADTGWKLATGTYDVNWVNVGYADHSTWIMSCKTWTLPFATNLGSVTINSSGNVTGGSGTHYISYASNWAKFDLPTANANTGTQESGVCISDSGSHDGNQAPLKLI